MREPYTPAVPSMDLYVPIEGKLSHVKRGSAIVGVRQDDHIRCYYEGGVYQQDTFENYIANAAGRLSERYPTAAIAYAQPDDVVRVGSVEWDTVLQAWVVRELTNEAALRQWTDDVPPLGGSDEQKQRAAGLIIDNGRDIEAMLAYQTAVGTGTDPIEAIISYARQKADA